MATSSIYIAFATLLPLHGNAAFLFKYLLKTFFFRQIRWLPAQLLSAGLQRGSKPSLIYHLFLYTEINMLKEGRFLFACSWVLGAFTNPEDYMEEAHHSPHGKSDEKPPLF